MAAVGKPPTEANQAEEGFQPSYQPMTIPDTHFNAVMTQLSSKVTRAGDGSTAQTPRKVLIIVTDGVEEDATDIQESVMDSTKCTLFKDMGYTVYVLYTTYYPLMHISYLDSKLYTILNSGGPQSVVGALQACASSSEDFIEARNPADINAALQTFLSSALTTPARFTQ
jgi:hypothetical protein